jgi:hypothetical protein
VEGGERKENERTGEMKIEIKENKKQGVRDTHHTASLPTANNSGPLNVIICLCIYLWFI